MYEFDDEDREYLRRLDLGKHGPKNGRRSPKKRVNGEGTVFPVQRQRKDGTTVTVFWATKTVELGAKRKKITAQAKTEKEAIDKRDLKILHERVAYGLESPEAIPADPKIAKLTVADCLMDWLKEKQDQNLSQATMHMYDARIRNHLLPAFGGKPVRALTYAELKIFFGTTLPDKGLGVDSIRQTFICLRSALDFYLRDGVLIRHPMVGLKAPAKKKKTVLDTLAIREASGKLGPLIIQEARKSKQELRWIFGLLGLRQAEALGLTDDCLVERAGLFRLIVKQQLQRTNATHGCELDGASGRWACGERAPACPRTVGATGWTLTETKTVNGYREIVISKEVWISAFHHIKEMQKKRELPTFHPERGKGLDKLLFTRENGKPIYGQRDRKALDTLIGKIEYKYGLPAGFTVHTLRHMATTSLIEGGADLAQISATMGWSYPNAQAQLATYSSADTAKQAAGTVEAYLDGILADKRIDLTGWEEL